MGTEDRRNSVDLPLGSALLAALVGFKCELRTGSIGSAVIIESDGLGCMQRIAWRVPIFLPIRQLDANKC